MPELLTFQDEIHARVAVGDIYESTSKRAAPMLFQVTAIVGDVIHGITGRHGSRVSKASTTSYRALSKMRKVVTGTGRPGEVAGTGGD